MKITTVTFVGNTYNKLLIKPVDDIIQMVTDCRNKHPQLTYRLPNLNGEFLQISYDKKLSNLITYGTPMRVAVKLVSYDFVDTKTHDKVIGSYLQLIGVIP
jgi:hypothetical protein